MSETPPPETRVPIAFTIIAAILAAFLYSVTTPGSVQPWLVVLVSVLGLAAAAAVLGSDAVRTGYAAVRELRR